MIQFDISTRTSALKFLSEFSKVHKANILNFVDKNIVQLDICTDYAKINARNFCKEFNLKKSDLSTENILLCAIHYTSNYDENKSIKNFGLRDLQYTLSHNTPLRNFLKEFNIEFDIMNKFMYADGKKYNIEYTRYEQSDPVTHIARKIYHDNQLSCFFSIDDIEKYLGCVHLRPEILYNIDELLTDANLSQEWYKRCKSYKIKFCAKTTDFAPYSFKNENISIAENMIDMALEVISEYGAGEIFAYLKPDTVIPFDNILQINEI